MTTLSFQAIPMPRIFDLAKAKDFYVDFLGFRVDWEHRFDDKAPVYMRISRDGLVLHLTEHHGDCCPGSAVLIHTSDIGRPHGEISAKAYPYLRPGVEIAPWRAKVMELIDPFRNRLRFNESLSDGEDPR